MLAAACLKGAAPPPAPFCVVFDYFFPPASPSAISAKIPSFSFSMRASMHRLKNPEVKQSDLGRRGIK